MTQWLRKITVQYGQEVEGSAYGPLLGWTVTSDSDEDLRVVFRFNRTNTNRADSGTIIIYNLPDELRDAMDSGVQEANDDRASILKDPRFERDIDARNAELRELAQANIVKVYAGYLDETRLIFQGDITSINVRGLNDNVNTVTEIMLGDAIIPLKYGYMQKTFGGGSTLADVLGSVVAAAGVPASPQALEFLDTVVPGVAQISFKNGYVVQGGVQHNVDEIVAAFGVQWFVRNGESYFMARGAVFDDFSLALKEGENVLRPTGTVDGNDTQFRMLLDGDMVPGRGFRIFAADGFPTSRHGYRADTVDYIGDTHGRPWYCTVRGRRISVEDLPPPFFPLTPEQALATAGPGT